MEKPKPARHQAGELHRAVVGGNDRLEAFARALPDDSLERILRVFEIDVNPGGDLGNQRVLTVGSHHQLHAERGGGLIVGGDSIAGMGRD